MSHRPTKMLSDDEFLENLRGVVRAMRRYVKKNGADGWIPTIQLVRFSKDGEQEIVVNTLCDGNHDLHAGAQLPGDAHGTMCEVVQAFGEQYRRDQGLWPLAAFLIGQSVEGISIWGSTEDGRLNSAHLTVSRRWFRRRVDAELCTSVSCDTPHSRDRNPACRFYATRTVDGGVRSSS